MKRLTFLLSLTCVSVFSARAEPASLFDGQSLKNWKSPDMTYWSVKDGAITAQSSEEHPCTHNQFIVWQGGEIANFELNLKFRIEGGPQANSGVQIRSQVEADGHVVGYQVDIADPEAPYLGAVYDEKGRKMLASRGQRAVISETGQITATPLNADGPEAAMKSYKPGEWTAYRIRFVDNKLQVFLNGIQTAEVIDHDLKDREMSGVLALQLHSGPPMTVQFKDIRLEKLD